MIKADKALGRLVLRFWAVIAFLASIASFIFGIMVIPTSVFPGGLAILLGSFFVWIGMHAWRDRATLGELYNRDYQSKSNSTSSQDSEG